MSRMNSEASSSDQSAQTGSASQPGSTLRKEGDGSKSDSLPSVRNGRQKVRINTQNPPRKKPGPSARSLIETRGPDPTTPLSDVRLTIGRIAGTHGVNGELKMRLLTDHPEHILTLKHVFLGESLESVKLRSARLQGPIAIIHLEGVETPEDGKVLGGLPVRILATEAKPLEEGEYFIFQLVGLQVHNSTGVHLGQVTDIIETGAHDVLVITLEDAASSNRLLVPNHPQFVLRIAPEDGLIVIEPPDYGD